MKHLLPLLLIGMSATAYGQGTISGKIVNAETNAPLPNVTITTPGNAITTSASDGSFSIDCTGTDIAISISATGFSNIKKTISCGSNDAIRLTPFSYSNDAVEITATSTNQKELLYQPLSIAKLGNTELKRGVGLYLDDAINSNVPGVLMQRRSVSGGQEFNIRGYGNGIGSRGASNNFDGQGYKVYLNGIAITDAEGITVLDDIDLGSVNDVEIVKGPAGTLYGLAIAGVVNLSTQQAKTGEVSVSQDAMMGSYGLQRYNTRINIGGKNSSLMVNYGHQTSNGFMPHNTSRKDFVNVMGTVNNGSKHILNSYIGYSHSYDERGGELTIDQFNNKDYSGNPSYIKNNAHSELISFRAGLSSIYTFNDHFSNTTSVFGSGVSNNSSSAAGWTDKNPVNYGFRSTLNIKYALGSKFSISGIAGGEAQQQYAQIIGYNMVADSNNLAGYNKIGAIKSNQATVNSTASAFTEWNLTMPYNIAVTAGIGWSMMDINLKDRFYVATSKNQTAYGANYNNLFSPHFAINKVFSKAISAYASYSKGYKAPVSSNIFIAAANTINTGLKPEQAVQYEIGSKGSLLHTKLTYTVAGYYIKYTDKMTSIAVLQNSSTTGYTYIANSGGQDNKGIEVLVKYTAYQSPNKAGISVMPFANCSYANYRYKNFNYQALNTDKKSSTTSDYNGLAVAGVPPITFNGGIDFNSALGFYASILYSYRDAMPITSDGTYKTSSFGLLNAKIGYRHTISDKINVNLYAGADNITGTQYYNMVFVNQLPDAYLPGPSKINYYGGVGISYTFRQ